MRPPARGFVVAVVVLSLIFQPMVVASPDADQQDRDEGGSPSGPSAPDPARWDDAPVQLRRGPDGTWRDPVDDAPLDRLVSEDGANLTAMAELLRRDLARQTGSKVPLQLSLPSARSAIDDGAAASHSTSYNGTYRLGVPTGDLTGEGHPDVLALVADLPSFDVRWQVLDQDGDEIWTRDAPDLPYLFSVPAPMGDLDGDGGQDFVFVRLAPKPGEELFDDCVTPAGLYACGDVETSAWSWTVTVVRGADGSDLWSMQVDGRVTEATSYLSGVPDARARSFQDVVVGRALSLSIRSLAGDGAHDLLVQRQDVLEARSDQDLYEPPAYLTADLWAPSAVSRYAVRDGAQGTVLHEGVAGPSVGVDTYDDLPEAVPLDDLTGDGADDLVVGEPQESPSGFACVILLVGECASVEDRSTTSIRAVDSRSGAPLWVRTFPGDLTYERFVWDRDLEAPGDLTGDGVRDVLFRQDGWWGQARSRFLDGTDGSDLWSIGSSYARDPLVPGDLDGDGGDDVVVPNVRSAPPGPLGHSTSANLTLTAYRGEDGTQLYRETLDISSSWVSVAPVGDMDGDAAPELAVRTFVSGSTRFVSGADGSALWSWDRGYLLPAGDQDGDGADDAVATFPWGECGQRWTTVGIDGPTGDTTWNVTTQLGTLSSVLGIPAGGSFDDGGTADVLRTGIELRDGRLRSRIRGLSGGTGEPIWTVGDDLPAPRCVPLPQDDAGSGGDAGTDGQALEIDPGTYRGTLDSLYHDDVDHYGVRVEEGDRVNVTVTPLDEIDVALSISGPGWSWDGSDRDGDASETAEIVAEETGEAIVAIYGRVRGNYSFTVDAPDREPLPQDDAGSGGDAGPDNDTAIAIDVGDHAGTIDPLFGDDADAYRLEVETNATVRAELSDGSLDASVTVDDLDGTNGSQIEVLHEPQPDDPDSDEATGDGPFLVTVHAGTDRGNYSVHVTVNGTGGDANGTDPAPTQDDAGSGADAGDNLTSALTLEPGSYDGTLLPDDGDGEDWYAFTASAGDRLSANMTPDDADFDLELVAPNGSVLDTSSRNGTATEQVEAVVDGDGTHYLRVVAVDGSGNYTFALDVSVPPRTEALRFEGRIGCAVTTPVYTSGGPCWVQPVGGQDRFRFTIDPQPSAIRTTVAWNQSALGADRMAFEYELNAGLTGAEGPSPLVHVQEVPSDAFWRDTITRAQLDVDATAGTVAVVGQPFEVCVTVAYGGAPLGPDPCV